MNEIKKKIAYFSVIFCCMAGMTSCETDYLAYDVNLKDGIYFDTDSLNYQFGMQKGEQFEYSIPVHVMGTPKNYDREFRVELIDSATSAKPDLHYELPTSFTVPANAVSGNITLLLHRYLDPNLAQEPLTITFKLIENDHFQLVMGDICKLEFSDTELPRPRWWSEWYFGPYSQMLMMDILNAYWDLEATRPLLFDRIVAEYGRDLEWAYSFPYQQEIAFIKYIITPVYAYYLENPHPNVAVPDPATLL